jgi:hypothetical protein
MLLIGSGWEKTNSQPWRLRWIVERTFGWLSKYRALNKDYEYHYQNSESIVCLVMIHIHQCSQTFSFLNLFRYPLKVAIVAAEAVPEANATTPLAITAIPPPAAGI